MEVNESTTIVVDTSVLINFLCIDRIDLIARHSHSFVVTEHVAEKVKNYYSDERRRLNNAFKSAILREERVKAGILANFAALSAEYVANRNKPLSGWRIPSACVPAS